MINGVKQHNHAQFAQQSLSICHVAMLQSWLIAWLQEVANQSSWTSHALAKHLQNNSINCLAFTIRSLLACRIVCLFTSSHQIDVLSCEHWTGHKFIQRLLWLVNWQHRAIFTSPQQRWGKRYTICPGICISVGVRVCVSVGIHTAIHTCIKVFVEVYSSAYTAPSFTILGVHSLKYLKGHILTSIEQDANVMHKQFWDKTWLFLKCWAWTLIGSTIMDSVILICVAGRGCHSRCRQFTFMMEFHAWGIFVIKLWSFLEILELLSCYGTYIHKSCCEHALWCHTWYSNITTAAACVMHDEFGDKNGFFWNHWTTSSAVCHHWCSLNDLCS